MVEPLSVADGVTPHAALADAEYGKLKCVAASKGVSLKAYVAGVLAENVGRTG